MTLLSLLGVSKRYGDKVLLNNIALTLKEKERIALIGRNGSGKSTLLKIIDSSVQQDVGQRMAKNDLQIAVLPQHLSFNTNHTVWQSIESSLSALKNAHDRWMQIANIQGFLDNTTLRQEYDRLYSYITQHDGWDLESKIQYIMQNFAITDYKNRLSVSLSGGEQKRVALACILLQNADVIILDEPTNHLDVEMVEFLEQVLCKISSTVIFISHDRYFIDKVATRIIELENGNLSNFIKPSHTEGAYLGYLQIKQQMLHSAQKEQEILKKILKSEEQWLQRGVQARRKRNEGRKERLLALRAKVKSMPSSIRNITQTLERTFNNLAQEDPKNNKKILFELRDFTIRSNDTILINTLNLVISQGEKIGVVGRNGSGKSTFLKALLGEYQDQQLTNAAITITGKLIKSPIRIGYFDQHKKMLQDSKTLIETFCPNGGDTITIDGKNIHVYGYLKQFLFPQSELEKKIGLLSGGEKSRVALALLFTKQYDCLILDEPTNDLDIVTMNIVEEYLQRYKGAVIFVSHDRYFVDKIAQRLLVLRAQDSTKNEPTHFISHKSYSEIIDQYNELKELTCVYNDEIKVNSVNVKNTRQTTCDKSQDSIRKQSKKLSYKDQLEYDNIESQIEELERAVALLEHRLATPEEYRRYGVERLSEELRSAQAELESKWQRFAALCDR
ncbi:ABC transporter ATP-binding protein [Helicobacter aurati]|uniref:ABC transporter ATP-binding protein n=1 Tax=Helicobacter aurati TaxID=137778 RepID=A0A3D8J8F1_9HELI|nr:ABC-F family ATP-binding cassette domain-containing protein [Helicobacter aurati]RDU73455.1 ABC transporter ATP-binding protein [Helicobacter aurati]